MDDYLELRFMSDPIAEVGLRDRGLEFEIVPIKFTEIDLEESRRNFGRLGKPIINDLVERYVLLIEENVIMPRTVAHRLKSGQCGFLAGNQRITAIEKLIKAGKLPPDVSMEVYLVTSDDPHGKDVFARSDNSRHGGPPGSEERLAQAIHCTISLGLSLRDAGKAFGVAPSTLSKHVTVEKEEKVLMNEGINTSSVPRGTLFPLARIKEIDLKKKVAHLIVTHAPCADRIKKTCSAVANAGSQEEKLQHIKKLEKSLAAKAKDGQRAKHPGMNRPRRDRVIGKLSSLLDYLETGFNGTAFTSDSQLQLDMQDRKRFIELWDRIQFRMNIIGGTGDA